MAIFSQILVVISNLPLIALLMTVLAYIAANVANCYVTVVGHHQRSPKVFFFFAYNCAWKRVQLHTWPRCVWLIKTHNRMPRDLRSTIGP